MKTAARESKPATKPAVEPAAKAPRRTALAPHATLSHAIYDAVRKRLQHGLIGPDDRVLDHALAEEFACTRMPVRQALLRLVSDGYLVGTTRGFVVPVLTPADVREIFEMRRLLEPHAAAGAAAALGDTQRAALARACAQASRAVAASDTALLVKANIAFRKAWLGGVRNTRLRQTIELFADHANQVRDATLCHPPTQAIVVDGMHHLLQGFAAADAAAVGKHMRAFTEAAERQYFLLLRQPGAAAASRKSTPAKEAA